MVESRVYYFRGMMQCIAPGAPEVGIVSLALLLVAPAKLLRRALEYSERQYEASLLYYLIQSICNMYVHV